MSGGSSVDRYMDQVKGEQWENMSGFRKFVYVLQWTVWVGSSAFITWAGAHYKDTSEYPCNKDIALWLLVWGAVSLALVSQELLMRCAAAKQWAACLMCIVCFILLIGLFQFCWFIVGSVWVFSTNETDCPADDGKLFKIGFWYLIALYIAFGLQCIYKCCTGWKTAQTTTRSDFS